MIIEEEFYAQNRLPKVIGDYLSEYLSREIYSSIEMVIVIQDGSLAEHYYKYICEFFSERGYQFDRQYANYCVRVIVNKEKRHSITLYISPYIYEVCNVIFIHKDDENSFATVNKLVIESKLWRYTYD